MADSSLTLLDQKVFVPSKDFELSLSFYQALGWTLNWRHEGGLAELELGNHRFFLQKYYQKDWAENFMIYLNVSDV
ncbi:MAG: glyoxalase, partial [Bacteroidota bacterium]